MNKGYLLRRGVNGPLGLKGFHKGLPIGSLINIFVNEFEHGFKLDGLLKSLYPCNQIQVLIYEYNCWIGNSSIYRSDGLRELVRSIAAAFVLDIAGILEYR